MATNHHKVEDSDHEIFKFSYKTPVTKEPDGKQLTHLDVLARKKEAAQETEQVTGATKQFANPDKSPAAKKIAAARERARIAAERARAANEGITKSDLDLDVPDADYIAVARTHPIESDLDRDVGKMQLLAQHQEKRESTGLIAGPGENLKLNRIAEQALKMLGSGLKPSIVASALGVTPGYISQLQENPDFASAVTERKIITLTRNSEHDDRIHDVEAKALEKLSQTLPFMSNPKDIARVFTALNNAKRRGAGAAEEEHIADASTVVQLTLPAGIRARIGLQIEVNDKNQVTTAGSQSLGAINPKHLMEHYRDVQKGEKDITALSPQATTIDSAAQQQVVSKMSAARTLLNTNEGAADIGEISLDEL